MPLGEDLSRAILLNIQSLQMMLCSSAVSRGRCSQNRHLQHRLCAGLPQRRQHIRHCQQLLTGKRPRQLHCSSAVKAAPPSDSSAAEHGAIQRFKDAVGISKAPNCCQGFIQLDAPVTVFGSDLSGQPFAVQLPLSDEAALQPLLDACQPASTRGGGEQVTAADNGNALIHVKSPPPLTGAVAAATNVCRCITLGTLMPHRAALQPNRTFHTFKTVPEDICAPDSAVAGSG